MTGLTADWTAGSPQLQVAACDMQQLIDVLTDMQCLLRCSTDIDTTTVVYCVVHTLTALGLTSARS
eukprot:20732-Heterococcus_DN1.PRE.2